MAPPSSKSPDIPHCACNLAWQSGINAPPCFVVLSCVTSVVSSPCLDPGSSHVATSQWHHPALGLHRVAVISAMILLQWIWAILQSKSSLVNGKHILTKQTNRKGKYEVIQLGYCFLSVFGGRRQKRAWRGKWGSNDWAPSRWWKDTMGRTHCGDGPHRRHYLVLLH